jgi:hypothetical protein
MMRRRPIVIQRSFLSFDDEETRRVELEVEYQREAVWRQSESLLALTKWLALPKRPRPPWQEQQVRISVAVKSLEDRANEMRRQLTLTQAMIWRHYGIA